MIRFDAPEVDKASGKAGRSLPYYYLQLNPGLTDRDFDPKNPNYNLK